VTGYEKRAALEFLNDIKDVFLANPTLVDRPDIIIQVMNNLLVDDTGATHWRYGTPTMYLICSHLCEIVTGQDQDRSFPMGEMPRYVDEIVKFTIENRTDMSSFVNLFDQAIESISQETIA
jgi:hypothetical protein